MEFFELSKYKIDKIFHIQKIPSKDIKKQFDIYIFFVYNV